MGRPRPSTLARTRAALAAHPLAAALAVLVASLFALAVLPADTLPAMAAQSLLLAALVLAALVLICPQRLALPHPHPRPRNGAAGTHEAPPASPRAKSVLVPGVLGVALVAGALSLAALPAAPGPAPEPAALAVRIALALAVCVGTGIFEEGLFRVIALDALVAVLPPGRTCRLRAAALSAAVFGLLHLGGTPPATGDAVAGAQLALKPLEAALFGFVMAAVYFRTQSLWPAAGVHAAFDALSLAPMLAATGAAPTTHVTGQPADLVPLVAVALLLVPLVLAAARTLRCPPAQGGL